jgi:hypothetical protein
MSGKTWMQNCVLGTGRKKMIGHRIQTGSAQTRRIGSHSDQRTRLTWTGDKSRSREIRLSKASDSTERPKIGSCRTSHRQENPARNSSAKTKITGKTRSARAEDPTKGKTKINCQTGTCPGADLNPAKVNMKR